MSDEDGEGVDAARYSAFGELVEGTSHRYGYAGAYGYQTDTDGSGGPGAFPFLHVGARYYDPATGRFLQRDPIGILGGLNVYEYVQNRPASAVDPDGLVPIETPPWPPGESPFRPQPKPKPPKKPKPRPETPNEELDRISRRLNYLAAGFGSCAGLTLWFPPAAGAFAVGSGIAWGAATAVGGWKSGCRCGADGTSYGS